MEAQNELSIAYFQSKLLINKYELDRELVEQPSTYFAVAERAALAQSRSVAAKERLTIVEAELYPEVANDLAKRGEKTSEASIKSAINAHPEREAANKKLAEATFEAAQWQALRESFSSRAFMLRDLCSLTTSGYLSTQSVKGDAETAKAEKTKQAVQAKRTGAWRTKLDE